jgi:5-amino-6-(5-phosphoribosylamino)uracil reductase
VANRPNVPPSAARSAHGYNDDATDRRLVLSDEADLDRVGEVRAGMTSGRASASGITVTVRRTGRVRNRAD